MSYFQPEEHVSLRQLPLLSTPAVAPPLPDVIQKMRALHHALHRQLRLANYELVSGSEVETVPLVGQSVTTPEATAALAIPYRRPGGEAVTVERLMGREETASHAHIEARRHPAIELRLTPQHLVIELVLSPEAWWDQENLVGKLSVLRHRQDFYRQLRQLAPEYRLGFWSGIDLSEMCLSPPQFARDAVLNEWMATFMPGKDWLRVGRWYPSHDDKLDAASIHQELFKQVGVLYTLYQEVLWTGNNNFREFYRGPDV